jgi:broad specificity phosphatase PhoE
MSGGAARTPGTARIYMARHGRTAYNHERRFQGLLPVPLDAQGQKQARALAEQAAAHDFQALWSSPLLRARQTAEIVGERIGLTPRDDERLVETDAGAWTDRTFAEVNAEQPEQFARFVALDPTFAFPGGESFAAQAQRVSAALHEIARGELPALVVCHGVVIRLALMSLVADAAAPPARAEPAPMRVANGALVPLSVQALAEARANGGIIGAATAATAVSRRPGGQPAGEESAGEESAGEQPAGEEPTPGG